MLTRFAAALLATTLIAGSAIAAQPSGTAAANGTAPAVHTQSSSVPATTKAGKTVKHAARHRNHVRKHMARGKGHIVHQARHSKPAKGSITHQARLSKTHKA
jgi:hypothetical protein